MTVLNFPHRADIYPLFPHYAEYLPQKCGFLIFYYTTLLRI